jgi:DNA-binding SARP family transcriptional activator
MSLVRIALLGVPIIERDGALVQVDTRKAIALLAYLAVSEGPQSRDVIASLLWCDLDTSGARAALRRTLSTLKAALPDAALESDRRIILLRRATLDLDLDRFRAAPRQVRGHGHALHQECPTCLPTLIDAVAWYRAEFLSGFALRDSVEFDDWQRIQAELLGRDLAEALQGIVAGLSAAGRFTDAIGYAQRRLALDPLNEAAHRALMQLYSRAGRRPAAVRQYRDCVRLLEEELAVTPVEETTRLYQAIKERDERPLPASEPAVPLADPPASLRLPLVGRSREWQALLGACEAGRRGGHIVVLEGEAGIGKTRLITDLLEHMRSGGTTALSARCYEGETYLAYAPILQLLRAAIDHLRRSAGLDRLAPRDLREAARLLPDMDALLPPGVASASPEPPGAQTRFLEGISRVLLAAGGNGSLILALDDLQWADAASLECLIYLLRRLEGRHICLVLAWRGEDLSPVHLVRRVITEARRAGKATVLQPARLDRASVKQLVEYAALSAAPAHTADLSERLYEETEGLPLFLSEYLTALADGALVGALPLGVRELLLSRLATISETGRQFLSAAAVIGRSFDFDTLHEASGRAEEMAVAALEELSGHGLVREVAGGITHVPTYDFHHDKLRALVYDSTGPARRRLLHRRVAEVLSGRSVGRHDDSLAGRIAHHYQLAGLAEPAAASFQRAGDYARALFANREAVAHYQAALALGHPAVAALHEALGDLHTLLGEYRVAVADYESAAALTEGRSLANIEHKLGNAHHRWGAWESAESCYEAALALFGEGQSAEQARLHADWSMAAYHGADIERSARLARSALRLAEEAGDVRALAQAHNMLGILAGHAGDRAAARDHLSRSLSLAEALPDPSVRLPVLQNLAFACRRDDDLAEARRFTRAALDLCAAQGDRHREAALHNTMADLLHAAGDGDGALAHVKRAVSIYAEIGVEAGDVRPEVWKLTEW